MEQVTAGSPGCTRAMRFRSMKARMRGVASEMRRGVRPTTLRMAVRCIRGCERDGYDTEGEKSRFAPSTAPIELASSSIPLLLQEALQLLLEHGNVRRW